jgi:uncharacterized phage protein (TIGR01671 family)
MFHSDEIGDGKTSFHFYFDKGELKAQIMIHYDELEPMDFKHFPSEVMQFTDLKDKNGKEIYEGDIVDRDSNMRILAPEHINFCVYWGSFCWMRSEQLNKHGVPFDPIDARSNCIIVGNIYEHPHLLNPATPTQ